MTSEQVEAFGANLQKLDAALAKMKSTQVENADVISRIASTAKEWLTISSALRSTVDTVEATTLELFDRSMRDVLNSTTGRSRASSYRSKLKPVLLGLIDDVVVPLIRFEGSPTQVAARRLKQVFTNLNPEEEAYVDEAVRCSASRCHRAALIMIWAASIARLHRAVEKVGFNDYNTALAKCAAKTGSPYNRIQKTGTISSLPELQRLRDFDILVVGMELWNYDLQVFQELDRLLGIRNNAAHPGLMQPTTTDVLQFGEKATTYVFSRIPT